MKIMLVSTPNGSTIGNLIASMGHDVEFCSATDSIKGKEYDAVYFDELCIPEPIDDTYWCKKKDSLNHLPYKDRKKFWNRK